jgi:predicted nucleic acid-binding protein
VILADTSVWVEHLRRGVPAFAAALENGHISIHTVVLGELACGNLMKRSQTLAALRSLPRAKAGRTEECLDFIEVHRLHGRGIGWSDVQLLVSARLSGDPLWSLDDRLAAVAAGLSVAYADR